MKLILKIYETTAKLITNLIFDIQCQIRSRVSDSCISHYLKEHEYIPLKGLNIILTLGTISNFYKVMNQKEKQETSKIFKIQDNELENILMKYILQSKHKGVIYV